ncbi:hypothetical protein KIN20_021902 [Parelaphostrongylus tenuis]|uniref:Uncharacterized protein n=1 Tax=Parelaphostrongylus tenuis TaxID=148309 RepID=A0AAD5N551_PARTN|nr:hypothetical protein KIN20_021902 [Parelaphostrongylus tenuis]
MLANWIRPDPKHGGPIAESEGDFKNPSLNRAVQEYVTLGNVRKPPNCSRLWWQAKKCLDLAANFTVTQGKTKNLIAYRFCEQVILILNDVE